MSGVRLLGAIFDVDGVLVDSPHERAWRESLDELMQGEWAGIAAQTRWRPGALTSALYAEHVAGKPREDGARAALEALGIPDGDRVQRYSEAKQALVAKLIQQDAFRPFDDGVGLLLRLKDAGLRVAAASSSRNAGELLARVRVAEVCRRRGESYGFVETAPRSPTCSTPTSRDGTSNTESRTPRSSWQQRRSSASTRRRRWSSRTPRRGSRRPGAAGCAASA